MTAELSQGAQALPLMEFLDFGRSSAKPGLATLEHLFRTPPILKELGLPCWLPLKLKGSKYGLFSATLLKEINLQLDGNKACLCQVRTKFGQVRQACYRSTLVVQGACLVFVQLPTVRCDGGGLKQRD
jgi:hypothetical protein